MSRWHLFEFEDQSWLPRRLRNAMTAYLACVYGATPLPKLWAEQLASVMADSHEDRIVDLGSGSGGPLTLIETELKKLGREPKIQMTDLYPRAIPGYFPNPVDATKVPETLPGVRTMFASFHHFRPNAARAILEDAFRLRRPICVFEGSARNPASIVGAILIPILVLLMTPRIRPVSAFQIFFTYLIPILPLLIFWDGLVSQLRTYSVDDLREMTSGLESPGYRWEAGLIRAPAFPMGVPFLTGRTQES